MYRKTAISITCSVLALGGAIFGGVSYMQSKSPRQAESEGGVTVVKEELSYLSGDEKVFGELFRPEEAVKRDGESARQRLPLIVFCHGLGMTGQYWEPWCKAAAAKGFAAYSFDFQGGTMTSGRSTGDITDMTAETELSDLSLVMKRISHEKFIDRSRIFLAGHSLGGLVAALYASDKGRKDIDGLILLAPAFNLTDDANEMYPHVRDIPDTTVVVGCTLGSEYFKVARKLDPYKKLHRFTKPTLVIQGGADDKVPSEYTEKAASEFPSGELLRLPDTDHNFSGKARQEAIDAVLDFVSANLPE